MKSQKAFIIHIVQERSDSVCDFCESKLQGEAKTFQEANVGTW